MPHSRKQNLHFGNMPARNNKKYTQTHWALAAKKKIT